MADVREKVRPALDAWLIEQQDDDLPTPLVAAARALAAEVDSTPRNSPLWGLLTTILTELVSPAVQARAFRVEQRQLIEQIAIAGHDEKWRAAKYREAVEAGMDPTPWERVVPISCAQGLHHWKRADYGGAVRCRWCDTVQPRREP